MFINQHDDVLLVKPNNPILKRMLSNDKRSPGPRDILNLSDYKAMVHNELKSKDAPCKGAGQCVCEEKHCPSATRISKARCSKHHCKSWSGKSCQIPMKNTDTEEYFRINGIGFQNAP